MNKLNLWAFGAVIGAATFLAAVFALMAAVAVALLVIPLVRRPGGVAALSGLLTSFGGLWLVGMAAQSLNGGQLDNAPFWATVGAVPFAIGLALLFLLPGSETPGRHAAR